MAAAGVLGARLYCNDTPLVNIEAAVANIGDFQGLTITTEAGLIESLGELGRVFSPVNFQAVADGRMYKLKGGYDDGNMQLTFGQDLTDAGQFLLNEHAQVSDQNTYPHKITLVGADPSFSYIYFGAKVMSYRTQLGAVNVIVKAMVTLEINTPIYIGAS